MDVKMELRRKRFANDKEVVVPVNQSQRTIISTVPEDFEMDVEGDKRADGQHILKPIVETTQTISYKNLSLNEVIAMRKKTELEEINAVGLSGAHEMSLDDIIKRSKLIASRRSTIPQVVDDKPYDPNVALADVIKSEKFKHQNSNILARLEQEVDKKVKIRGEEVAAKRGRSETLDEKWERINFAPKVAYNENTLDSMNANGVSMDALKILEILAAAGNRIKILIYNVKDIEAEKKAAGVNWIAQRWLVEIFLVGMDPTGSKIVYKTMGIGAANKKLLAKYAAAEDLYYNLRKTKYITEFPKYYIPIVHRLSVTIHEQVIQFLETNFPEGYETSLNIKIVVNDPEKDEPYYSCSFVVNDTVMSEVTHANEDHAELLAMYRGYEALTGTKYEAENYLKGPKVNADLSRYLLIDTQAKTVATVPFEILSEATQQGIQKLQEHRNSILTKKFTIQQEVDNRNMTEAEMDGILAEMSQCKLSGHAESGVVAEEDLLVDEIGIDGDASLEIEEALLESAEEDELEVEDSILYDADDDESIALKVEGNTLVRLGAGDADFEDSD